MSNNTLVCDAPDLERTRNISREGEIVTEQHLSYMSVGRGTEAKSMPDLR